MISLRTLLLKIESYLFGVKLETFESGVHGRLELWMINGKLVVNSGNANQSFDSLHRVFRFCLNKIKDQIQPGDSVLLLGFGVGSVASILEDELKLSCRITAVEKDPVMLALGQTHFNTGRFKQLTLIEADALHFVNESKEVYDLVIIDLFADNKVPETFTSIDFLSKINGLMGKESRLLFNFMLSAGEMEDRFNSVISFFASKKGKLEILKPVHGNRVVYWTKGT